MSPYISVAIVLFLLFVYPDYALIICGTVIATGAVLGLISQINTRS